MPVNVSLSIRASVTAGFANAVEDVKRSAAAMNAPTETAMAPLLRPARTIRKMSSTSTAVTAASDAMSGMPSRPFTESATAGRPKVRFAIMTPMAPPTTWATT